MECNPIIDVSNVNDAHIYLGVFATFNARAQRFDLSAWQAKLGINAAFSVSLLRPGDAAPYAVSDVSIDGATATWTFDAIDTQKSGYGKVFLSYAGEDFLEKTIDIPVYIAENCGPTGDTPPDPLKSWYQNMLDASAAAQAARTGAQEAAGAAAESATAAASAAAEASASESRAEAAAEQAEMSASNAGYFYVEGRDDGHLYYIRTDNTHDIDLKDVNGRLVAVYG